MSGLRVQAGAALRAARQANGTTCADIAEAVGVGVSHIATVERGDVSVTVASFTRYVEAAGLHATFTLEDDTSSLPVEAPYGFARTPAGLVTLDELDSIAAAFGMHAGVEVAP